MRQISHKDGRFPLFAKRLVLLLLTAGALIPIFFLLYSVAAGSRSARGNLDFTNLYLAGTIVRRGASAHLYDLPIQHRVEREVSSGPFLPFDHPPFEAWLCLPLSYLSYPAAYLVWAAFNLALTVGLVYLLAFSGFRQATETYLVWLAVTILLVIGVLLLGQDTLLVAVVFLVAFLALKRRREYVAGLALGLGLFRFEILLPFVFIFLLRRRWKVLAGFLGASALALFASVALVGWRGILDYGNVLLQIGRTEGSAANGVVAATMPTLRGVVPTFLGGVIPPQFFFPLILIGTLALLIWAAWEFKNIAHPEVPAFALEFSLAVLAALLSSYHLFVHELTPLIVIGFLMLAYEGTKPHKGILRNRQGTALLLLFAVVYGIGGAVFHFREFSVLFIVLLGLMIWLSQELSILRGPGPGF